MPMAWATSATLTYNGDTPTSDPIHWGTAPFTEAPANEWDYCYTLNWSSYPNPALHANDIFYIPAPSAPTSIVFTSNGFTAGSGTWSILGWDSTNGGRIGFQITSTPPDTGTAYFEFFGTHRPVLANPSNFTTTNAAGQGGMNNFRAIGPLYTNPEPGAFALGAIVLGMAGGLWRRRPRKKSPASTPPTDL
jgi:hypothetical protein